MVMVGLCYRLVILSCRSDGNDEGGDGEDRYVEYFHFHSMSGDGE